ncbi:MAG: four helix bundle protein [bacterium]|nr:four helix bundle protein [bacterium]
MGDYYKPVKPGFEKLRIWKKAYDLMMEVHTICKTLPLSEKYIFKSQSERSSSSVVDNIAESNTSYYYNDKIKAAYVARKEAGETQSHLRKMEGKKYITSDKTNYLIDEYEGLIRGINAYVNYVCEKRDKVPRHSGERSDSRIVVNLFTTILDAL